ncbi:MAG: surface glycoprotein, partial [Clostridia bacterium]|nr:surface glycoprotein [Clostridia bacterium]
MKKLTALLLALIMVLSVFAACGEKQETPSAQDTDTALGADVTPPANGADDEEESDKEATETVTETGEV